MKIALVYDRVNKWGGAERILLALHRLFPKAPLYTSVYDKQKAPWAKVFTVYPSFIQSIPFAKRHHEFFPYLMPLAFETMNFDQYDLVISVTSEAAKGIIVKGRTKHICICLTPTRYLWSGYKEYFSHPTIQFLTKPLVHILQKWDYIAAQRPDSMIAISKEVQKRITQYYKRKSTVIYPPITLTKPQQQNKTTKKEEYFLVVSRLSRFTQYKRVDLAIRAANKLKIPLIIVGDGDIAFYKKIAGSTIKLVGKVSDTELVSYYQNCKALIFPGLEDFGLVMAEAQQYGKPVIAYRAGGAKEIIKDGKTGVLFSQQTVASLTNALKSFQKTSYNSKDCIKNADKFSIKQFEKKLTSIILQTKKSNETRRK